MPILAACIQAAALIYGFNAQVIPALIRTEGGQTGLAVQDANGTTDYGLLQVNSSHLPQLNRLGYTPAALANDNCANIMAGAWVYASCLRQTPGSPLDAAACYNAGVHPWLAWQDGYVARFAVNLGLPIPAGALRAASGDEAMSWPDLDARSTLSSTPTPMQSVILSTAMRSYLSGPDISRAAENTQSPIVVADAFEEK